MRLFLLLPFLFLLAACSPDGADAPADGAEGGAEMSTTDDGAVTEPTLDGAEAEPKVAADGAVVTFIGITPGDRMCYVKVRDEAGDEFEDAASFEVCETPGLEGQPMRITRTMENVVAESCEGNLECGESESVSLITAVEPAE